MSKLNRILGAYYGTCCGDALGAPHELMGKVPLELYTGMLQYAPVIFNRYNGTKRTGVVGQITDDSIMTGLLLRQTVTGKYDPDVAVDKYLSFANNHTWCLGRNTRSLFLGVKTQKGYHTRYDKSMGLKLMQCESNGSLMRLSGFTPLAWNHERVQAFALSDTILTNPAYTNLEATRVYIQCLDHLINNVSPGDIPGKIQTTNTDIARVLHDAVYDTSRSITQSKGWVCHGLYCALRALYYAGAGAKYSDIINWVVKQGGDTDTNGAIAGGLLGFHYGLDVLLQDPTTAYNINTIRNADYSTGELPVSIMETPLVIENYVRAYYM